MEGGSCTGHGVLCVGQEAGTWSGVSSDVGVGINGKDENDVTIYLDS